MFIETQQNLNEVNAVSAGGGQSRQKMHTRIQPVFLSTVSRDASISGF